MSFSILRTHSELTLWQQKQKAGLHFVPTMGGLHRGHQQLITTAKGFDLIQPNPVLVSIFVNPLQFGKGEDFDFYPRDLSLDCELAQEAGADAVWAPSVDEIFPGGADSHRKLIAPLHLQANLCGLSRIGHFDGVANVMIRLLSLVKPKVLVLGEKDWQQFVILRQLIKDLSLPIQIKGVATVREADGLPHSSRNRYLTKSERQKVLALPQLLTKAARDVSEGEILDLKKIRASIEEKGLKVEYLEIVDPLLLRPVTKTQQISLLAAAVHCGSTRLIDHIFLMKRHPIVAIDGPAGAGKSTITRTLAERLDLVYLDTGAMYRAVTWLIKQQGIKPENHKQISFILKDLKLELRQSIKEGQTVLINGKDVTELIRSPEITASVSKYAAEVPIREALTKQQKEIGINGGIVAEGRDIGTAVFPDAELKVFLTATPNERAKRRAADMANQGFEVPSIKELEAQINERDQLDSNREISPLRKAKDATELITDGMSIEDVTQALIELFRSRIPEEVWPTPRSIN